jgi:hypothetical protein
MRDNPRIQGNYKGINKLCSGCIKSCKQFANVRVIQCSYVCNSARGQNALEAPSSTISGS